MDELNKIFSDSLQTGFIDKKFSSKAEYQPNLLVNKKEPPTKVLSTILRELEACEEFYFSVAFVTTSGVATIINKLEELENRNVKGKILVSQYLNFTQPEALKRLLQFKNIQLRIAVDLNSHSKGYIFKRSKHFNLIVGSSNLTANALTINKEWNVKVSALDESGLIEKVLNEFHSDFHKGTSVTEEFLQSYENDYNKRLLFSRAFKSEEPHLVEQRVSPNTMQEEALSNLKRLRSEKKNKALIISATGTGKTYLSAFDAKEFAPKKLLFVVHRLTIAKDAKDTFRKVFGKDKSMGIYSGVKRELDCDFVFSTIQTISKTKHLEKFSSDHFDYIIIDETHRSGADSYLRLINHFEPKFLLGMTATPERTDGNDIFQLFDHNIAYEIRLKNAMEEDMLSSFHYFGVADLIVDDHVIDNSSSFNLLVSNERVARIVEKAEFYGSDNGITRGLIFCSRKKEAQELSELFNQRGFKTVALTGDSLEDERSKAIEKLETNELSDKLDYIFTVDIFNEGVDIPKINQIIMLRPTESAIIFVQQLGRGLRKVEGKDYLTIIDFIGNYKNNFLIPIALYGDTSYNKDSLRKLLTEGSRMIPGASTINFDEITKDRIFNSIDSANMQLFSELKKEYNLLKFKLGRIPQMMDFIEHGSRDPFLFVVKAGSMYNFIVRVDKEFTPELTHQQSKLLELFSKEINNAKRLEESYILRELIVKNELSLSKFKNSIFDILGYHPNEENIDSFLRNINFQFVRKNENIIYLKDEAFFFYQEFLDSLTNQCFKNSLLDSINYSITTFENSLKTGKYSNGLILYNKYSRKDVCRLLNWEKDISSTLYGYRTNQGITPCFVTYHKSDEIEGSINYKDHFINPATFAWDSRSNRSLDSPEINNVVNSERILLFVKKTDGEGTDFYFMGDVSIIPGSIKQGSMADSNSPVVHFNFQLEQPVIDSLYDYINSEVKNAKTEKFKEKVQQPKKKIKLVPVQGIMNLESKSTNSIPFYNFYAAAGSFSEMQTNKEYELLELPEHVKFNEDYFACKVVGESMNRRIPNGSICLFKKYSGGSRNGKIVLVEYRDRQDQDFNSSFTVKTYSSEKSLSEEGSRNKKITLRPNSYDTSYKDLVFEEENHPQITVCGEFVQVISSANK
jgi:superfamily II DNA or RNA helicase/HKD family nuclease/SOS-response transcriptional repressor LexA